jgi:hypothetical protein
MHDNCDMIWRCGACGFAGSWGDGVPMNEYEFPVHCICGLVEDYAEAMMRLGNGISPENAWMRCRYRGHVEHKIPGDWVSCGCKGIELHSCQHFGELITILPVTAKNDTADEVKRLVGELHPHYRGKDCRACIVPTESSVAPTA